MKHRSRTAVTPLRREIERLHAPLPSVDRVVAKLRPSEPVHCLRPEVLREGARAILAGFPGEILYAMKCNPEPSVLRALVQGGLRRFDVASPAEVALVRQMFPEATLHYMHPVKSRDAIRFAWHQHGVRDFAIDDMAELAKVRDETVGAGATERDLGLVVRLALPKGTAVYDLSGKFGAPAGEAVALLRAARPLARRLGLTFHVGSQCLDPEAWRRAIRLAAAVAAEAGVALDILDVGGGFPVAYAEVTPPPFATFAATIAGAVAEEVGVGRLPAGIALWAEPGRALCAPGVSVVVRVEHRRGDVLFINDGVYGSLSDAGLPGFRFPARLVRPAAGAHDTPFALFGPTCDSADRMAGPFLLPGDTAEGDWIELGQLGAYGGSLRTAFNGFDRARIVEVRDPPLVAAEAPPTASVRVAARG